MRRPSTARVVALLPTTILTMNSVLLRSAGAWSSKRVVHRSSVGVTRVLPMQFRATALFSTETDEFGRRIRTGGGSPRAGRNNDRSSFSANDDDNWGGNDGGGNSGGWDDFDAGQSTSRDSRSAGSSDGWDDFDPFSGSGGGGGGGGRSTQQRKPPPRTGDRRQTSSQRGGGGSGGGGRRSSDFRRSGRSEDDKRYGGGRSRAARSSSSSGRPPQQDGRRNSARGGEKQKARQINMNALSGAGFDHLYGLSSVLNALEANRRDFTPPEEDMIVDGSDVRMENDYDNEEEEGGERGRELQSMGVDQPERKPEAQFKPWLFIQERDSRGGRSTAKASNADQLTALAEERGLAVAEVDKGVLNTLCGNRPHQGFVLRCGKLEFEPMSRIPHPKDDPSAPSIWLVLDEVVDPQNLGALLRSAFFLGGDRAGVLVCSKNSAPPSPVVSAASAGALELMEVYSTSNLPRTLTNARDDGFRIVGASSSVPRSSSVGDDDDDNNLPPLYELQQLPPSGIDEDSKPVLLVLGSEGHGLRSLVAKACSEFVRIPSGEPLDGESSIAGVDSLNVSVTGGILLWHLLHGVNRSS